MRNLILAFCLAAGALALLALSTEPRSETASIDVSQVIYLLMWLVLVGGGFVALRQRQAAQQSGGPNALMSITIWAGIFALAVLLYRGVWFWTSVSRLIAGLLGGGD